MESKLFAIVIQIVIVFLIIILITFISMIMLIAIPWKYLKKSENKVTYRY